MRLIATLAAAFALATAAQAQTPVFDHVPPTLPKIVHPSVLILSKANGYRHDSIPAVSAAVAGIAARHGWTIYDTDNAAVFNRHDLRRFDIIVLNNTTGELFTPKQQRAFKHWLKGGGRIVALHGAGGTNPSPWPWYSDTVIGGRFVGHPKIQSATIHVEPGQAITSGLPASWTHSDEWYTFDRNPRDKYSHILAIVDEASYDPTDPLRMGADHPIIWTRCVGRGGVFYSAIGHQAENWSDPVFLSMIDNAMVWAFDRSQKAC